MGKTIKDIIRNPQLLFLTLGNRGLLNWMSDEQYLKIAYRVRGGGGINLCKPVTFNEKLNWLKLHDRNPLYTTLADKYEVKTYVAERIGDEYVVPCYGVWDSAELIDYETLPQSFVLKCTHDSSGALICRNKDGFDKEGAKRKINGYLRKNYYWTLREWVYKDIKPRVIADMFLDDASGHELQDYKFWCFNGEPKVMYCTNKAEKIYENFYDMDFKPLDINHGFARRIPEFDRPQKFELMKTLAKKLSAGIPFVRVDFFDVSNHIYFGEFTFYDWGGLKPFVDYNWDKRLGSWITLPNIHT